MSGRRDETLLLDDLIQAASRLIDVRSRIRYGYLGVDLDESEVMLWNLTVLGEATKRLREETRSRFPDVAWTMMAHTRDRIVHHYEGIDWHVVRRIVDEELPPVLPRLIAIRDLLREEFDRAHP